LLTLMPFQKNLKVVVMAGAVVWWAGLSRPCDHTVTRGGQTGNLRAGRFTIRHATSSPSCSTSNS
jgi:hypothetical protein